MTSVIEIRFLRSTSDSGDVTYQVQSRIGDSGDCPSFFTLHDSHYADDAIRAMGQAVRAARDQKLDRLR